MPETTHGRMLTMPKTALSTIRSRLNIAVIPRSTGSCLGQLTRLAVIFSDHKAVSRRESSRAVPSCQMSVWD